MYYIGLDVHKRTISYCVKDAAGQVHQEGKIGSKNVGRVNLVFFWGQDGIEGVDIESLFKPKSV
jgi:hypothetical protein